MNPAEEKRVRGQRANRLQSGSVLGRIELAMGETVTLSCFDPADPPAPAVAVPRQIGAVRLIREIGHGGMGVVWLGRHETLGRDVAVKFLTHVRSAPDPSGVQALLIEARSAASVRHPGLIAVHDAALVDGVPYLVMDYVDGFSLADVLRAVGPLAVGAALAVLDAVGDAVAALHDASLVHRDIKPRNILLDRAGRPYVGDFGLACACAPARRAQLGTAGGTPPYMAPEMFTGEASPRSDVYALGITLYEMLTGATPFRGETIEQIRIRHTEEPLPQEPLERRKVHRAVIEVLERATHKAALYRTKTARQLLLALHAAVQEPAIWARGVGEIPQLVARCSGDRPDTRPPENTTPSTSSYADLLATRAASKRGSEAISPSPPSCAAALAAPRPSVAGVLADDLTCLSCGYNLRGLSADGRCPECGAPVATTARPDRLMFADRTWLETLYRGQTMLLWMVACIALQVVITALAAILTNDPKTRGGPLWLDATDVGATLAQLVLFLLGIYWATAPDPQHAEPKRVVRVRRATRVAAFLAAGLSVTGPLARALDSDSAVVLVEQNQTTLFLAAFAGYLVCVASLAARIPDHKRERATRWSAIIFGVVASSQILLQITQAARGAAPSVVELLELASGRARWLEIAASVVGFVAALSMVVLVPARVLGWRRALRRVLANHIGLEQLVGPPTLAPPVPAGT